MAAARITNTRGRITFVLQGGSIVVYDGKKPHTISVEGTDGFHHFEGETDKRPSIEDTRWKYYKTPNKILLNNNTLINSLTDNEATEQANKLKIEEEQAQSKKKEKK